MKTITIKSQESKHRIINKPEDDNGSHVILALAIMQLDSGDIDSIIINGYPFTRKALEFKTSKNMNHTKAIDIMTWAYHSDIMNEIINYEI